MKFNFNTGLPRLCDQFFCFDLLQPFSSEPSSLTCEPCPPSVETSEQPVWNALSFSAATANVLTLYPGKAKPGMYVSAHQEGLLAQCHAANLHLVGVQETRARWSGHREACVYHLLAAPASEAGQGGVQLWVKAKWIMEHGFLNIRDRRLKILVSSTQAMAVHLKRPQLELILLVLHAPNNVPEGDLLSWWSTCSSFVPARLSHVAKIVLVDANARIGSLESPVVGSFGAEVENTPGRHFHQWCWDEHLFIPQSFPGLGFGPPETWVHSSGKSARLDYVAVDARLREATVSAGRCDLDLSISGIDHFAVSVTLSVHVPVARPTKAPIMTKACVSVQPPCVPWHCDVHTHADRLHCWMMRLQPGPTKRHVRKSHLSSATWHLISKKKTHWHRFVAIRKAQRQGILRAVFLACVRSRHVSDESYGGAVFVC